MSHPEREDRTAQTILPIQMNKDNDAVLCLGPNVKVKKTDISEEHEIKLTKKYLQHPQETQHWASIEMPCNGF